MKAFVIFGHLFISLINNAQTNLIKNPGFVNDLLDWRGQETACIPPYD